MSAASLLEQLIPGEARTPKAWCPTCELHPGMGHTHVWLNTETNVRTAP